MSKHFRFAAIDAGSNAIRLVVAQCDEGGALTRLCTERSPVRLGHKTFTKGALATKTIDRAVITFKHFREILDKFGVVQYRAVATSALRSASNREHLQERLYKEANIKLQVIDGKEESRLVRRAVLSAYLGSKSPTSIIDLGGGSLEVMGYIDKQWQASSMKIGTVRLLETFGLKGSIGTEEQNLVQRTIKATLASNLPKALRNQNSQLIAGCGGNVEALAKIFGHKNSKGMHILPMNALHKALPALAKADIKKRMERYNIRKDRAEVIGVAALALATLSEEIQIKELCVPGVGIRDGILQDLADSSSGTLQTGREAPLLASARSFAARLGHNMDHGEQVRMIALHLFTLLEPLHKLATSCSVILQVASLLHDIGEVVHRKSHHKHSEYLIMNGRISGLHTPERNMVAATARAHRKTLPSNQKHRIFSALKPKQKDEVFTMAVLLRLANTLDQGRRTQVATIGVDVGNDQVLLKLGLRHQLNLQTPGLLESKQEFEELFKRKLVIEKHEVLSIQQ